MHFLPAEETGADTGLACITGTHVCPVDRLAFGRAIHHHNSLVGFAGAAEHRIVDPAKVDRRRFITGCAGFGRWLYFIFLIWLLV